MDPLLHPRHWPAWAAAGLLRASVALPQPARLSLGRTLGRLAWRAAGGRRRVAEANLRLCLPELDEAARTALARRHFESAATGVLEAALAWWGRPQRLRALAEPEGLVHLERLRRQGRGVLLLTAHFTTLEIAAHLLSLLHPIRALYRPLRDPVFDRLMRAARTRRTERGEVIERGDVRAILRALREGAAVWYAPDQDHGLRQGVFAPFFGVPAATVTATSRLARATRAAVVPYHPERTPEGRYRLVIEPPLEDFPGPDPAADAARVNALIEGWVRRVPEQYLWTHRRFKTRPEGMPDPYARSAGAADTGPERSGGQTRAAAQCPQAARPPFDPPAEPPSRDSDRGTAGTGGGR